MKSAHSTCDASKMFLCFSQVVDLQHKIGFIIASNYLSTWIDSNKRLDCHILHINQGAKTIKLIVFGQSECKMFMHSVFKD